MKFIMIIETILIIISIYIISKAEKSYKTYNSNRIEEKSNKERTYSLKPIMTKYEYKFYKILKQLEDKYIIVPQLNLATVINKNSNDKYYNELFRNIDFAIFTKDYMKLLLLIEINDETHNEYNRKDRDLKVKKICNKANIRLITFYSKYPNEETYVLNRILNEIKNIESTEERS